MDMQEGDFDRILFFEHARQTAEATYTKNPLDADVCKSPPFGSLPLSDCFSLISVLLLLFRDIFGKVFVVFAGFRRKMSEMCIMQFLTGKYFLFSQFLAHCCAGLTLLMFILTLVAYLRRT